MKWRAWFIGAILVAGTAQGGTLRVHGSGPIAGSVPTISGSTTVNSSSPTSNGQNVGSALTASNTPTGWSINSDAVCNTTGTAWLSISAGGQLTVNATGAAALTGNLTDAVVTCTPIITASNAAGTSSPMTFSVTFYADGSAGAAATGQKYASLSTLGGGATYLATVPWQVAGVNYNIGTHVADCPGGVFGNPNTISGTGITNSPPNLTITGNSVTINCYDFGSASGFANAGMWTITWNGDGGTLSNSNFLISTSYTGRTGIININGDTFTSSNITMDGACDPASPTQPWNEGTVYNGLLGGAKSSTHKYWWLKNSCGQNFGFGGVTGGTVIMAYGLVENSALAEPNPSGGALVHNNFVQFVGGSFTPKVLYTTARQNGLGGQFNKNPGEGWQCESQPSGATLTNCLIAGNVIIAVPVTPSGVNTGQSLSYEVACRKDSGTTNTGFTMKNNYQDVRGAFGFAYPSASLPCDSRTYLNNIDLSTGSPFTNSP